MNNNMHIVDKMMNMYFFIIKPPRNIKLHLGYFEFIMTQFL